MLPPRMMLLVWYGTMDRNIWLNHFKEKMTDWNLTIYKFNRNCFKDYSISFLLQGYNFTNLRWTLTQEVLAGTIKIKLKFIFWRLRPSKDLFKHGQFKWSSKSVRSTWIWFLIHMGFRVCVINMLIQHCSVHEYFWYSLDHKRHVKNHVICDSLGHFDV